MLIGPRAVMAAGWLFSDWGKAFDATWMAVAGWLLLPWTSLAWIYTHFANGGDVSGRYVVIVLVALLFDLGTYGGGRSSSKSERG